MIKELERAVESNKDLYDDLYDVYPNTHGKKFKFSPGHRLLMTSIGPKIKKMGQISFEKAVAKSKAIGKTPTYAMLKAKLAYGLLQQYEKFDLGGVVNVLDYELELNVGNASWHLHASFKCQRCYKWLALSYSKNKSGSFSQYKFSNFVRHYGNCGSRGGSININNDSDMSEDSQNNICSVVESYLNDF